MAGVPMDSPMAAMIQMRMGQPQPLGAGASAGSPTVPSQDGTDFGGQDNSGTAPQPDPLAALASSANPNGGNTEQGAQLVALLQKILPALVLAEHHHGTFELAGPTQEQFLGAAAARHLGAKVHSVHNAGKGQRLHIAV